MTTVTMYLEQKKVYPKYIEYTDGQDTIKIPRTEIVERVRKQGKDWKVTVTKRWAKEEGVI